ncbi:MAG: hypothetical protein H7067_17050 [Burkholderiales bacterium]|nr:hypothetical protein [Opitutaceae bacterium]
MYLFRRLPVAAAALCAACLLALVPLQAAPLANDAFSRTVTSGWGSTPQSQAYTTVGGSASDYSVGSSRGEILLSTSGNRLARLGLSLGNVEGTVRIALSATPTSTYAYAGPCVRVVSAGNSYYYFRLKHAVGGDVTLTIQRLLTGSQTTLSTEVTVGTGYTAGAYYLVRFSAAGTSPTLLRAKAWPEAAPEPALWQVEYSDSTSTLQVAGGAGIRAGGHSSFAPLNSSYRVDDFKVHDVAYVSNLLTSMQNAVAGDILYFTGTHTGNMKTYAHGTAASPIIVRGVAGTVQTASQATGYGVDVRHNYWRFDNFTINYALKGFYAYNADYGVLTRIDITNTGTEGFKFRRYSNYWEVVECSVDGAGQNANDYGEGFYVGDAQANWATSTTPDTSGYIVFRACHVINTSNDPYDVKEGAHHIKFIGCVADFTGIEPAGGAARGDSGFYLRGDDLQLISCSVTGLGNGSTAYNANNALLNGIDYGNRIEFKAASATDITNGGSMFEIHSRCDDVEIYTDYTATNVAVFKAGSGSYTTPAPASFVELTW